MYDNKFVSISKLFSARNISLPHIIFFVTTWLQKVLCVKQLRHKGIGTNEIKKQSRIAAEKLVEGHREAKLRFNPKHKSKALGLSTVIVLVSLANIMELQKYSVASTVAQTICENLVSVGISSLESSALPEAESSFRTTAVTSDVNDNGSYCFALPFKTTDQSLLSADRFSSDLSSRLSNLVKDRDIPSMSAYFENSLRDNIKTNAVVVHGMDFATLEPGECLNDAVLKFWFNWVNTPRCPKDNTSSVHICSTYLLSSVLNDGYNKSYQKWLKNVNIFEKSMVLFPVHLAHHWSLIAVLNPKLIKQTKNRWNDSSYTRDVFAMIHLDSLGSGTVHNKQQLARAVRDILNKEWDKYYNNALDKTDRPFNHRHASCQLLSPKGESYLSWCYFLESFLIDT